MEFDDAKENIQPLAAGRNVSLLQASLRIESPQELLARRRRLEQAIHEYMGDDPLSPWYEYISWIEQSYPSGGKESGLDDVLTKCLSQFESDAAYYQDRRMVKLFIRFIDGNKDPTECYQQLYNAGIGTMIADFYICWAYYYDLSGNSRKADEIFRRGITCRAQPLDELQEAHQHFNFIVAQRLLYKDDEDAKEDANRQLHERRVALTSLRGHRRKNVGSIRTGAAVKSFLPGTISAQQQASTSERRRNERVQVFSDENENPNASAVRVVSAQSHDADTTSTAYTEESSKSVVRLIINATRNQENTKEPGPWNKAHDKKFGNLFSKTAKNDLGFNIHEDVEMDDADVIVYPKGERNFEKPFKYFSNHVSRNRPQPVWLTPVTIENESHARTIPEYNKCMLYPRPNMEFQMEELRAYYWFKRRDMPNEFTRKRDAVWSTYDVNANVRQYPNFAKQSRPQELNGLDKFHVPKKTANMVVPFEELYNEEEQEEYQNEEVLLKRLKRNLTISHTADMEETVCIPFEKMPRRKSFFPVSQSIARRSMAARVSMAPPTAVSKVVTSAKDTETATSTALPLPQSPVAIAQNATMKEVETEQPIYRSLNLSTGAIKKTATSSTKHVKSTSLFDVFEDITRPQIPVEPTASVENVTEEEHSPKDALQQNFVPFEIYEDPTKSRIELIQREKVAIPPQPNDSDFLFKTPFMPKSTNFEIYSDGSMINAAPQEVATVGSNVAGAGGGLFDPEETCSTQTFNIFLKSHFVSTPNAPHKHITLQARTVLKDVIVPTIQSLSPPGNEIAIVSPIHDKQESELIETSTAVVTTVAVASSTVTTYSPQIRKQLSTILETSEHGTTQGTTQSTGSSTTKSTINSPEFESDSTATGCASTPAVVSCRTVPYSELETLQEQSREISNITSSTSKFEELMQSMKLQMSAVASTVIKEESLPVETKLSTTPAVGRLQTVAIDHFSIFEDGTATTFNHLKQAGNFTRLETCGNTTAASLQPVRFLDDRTDTIPKMLFTSMASVAKFQDDKTETISKITLFEDEASGEEVVAAKQNIPLDMYKIPFQAPTLPAFSTTGTVNLDNSLDFFAKTPPKIRNTSAVKSSACKPTLNHSFCALTTPLASSMGKRFSDKETPKLKSGNRLLHNAPPSVVATVEKENKSMTMYAKMRMPLFEDELDEVNVLQLAQSPTKAKNNLFKSFVNLIDDDTSMIPPTQLIESTAVTTTTRITPTLTTDNKSLIPTLSKSSIRCNSNLSLSDAIPETQVHKMKQSSDIVSNSVESSQVNCTKLSLPTMNDDDTSQLQSQPGVTPIKWKQCKTGSDNILEYIEKKQNSLTELFMKDFDNINNPIKNTELDGSLHYQERQYQEYMTTKTTMNKSENLKIRFLGKPVKQSVAQNVPPTASINSLEKSDIVLEACSNSMKMLADTTTTSTITSNSYKGDSDHLSSSIIGKLPISKLNCLKTSKATDESLNTATSTYSSMLKSTSLACLSETTTTTSCASIATAGNINTLSSSTVNIQKLGTHTKLNFLPPKTTTIQPFSNEVKIEEAFTETQALSNLVKIDQLFELNAETAMFTPNLSMIKNSTLLSGQHEVPKLHQSQKPEKSLHIKNEPEISSISFKLPELPQSNVQKATARTSCSTINTTTAGAAAQINQTAVNQSDSKLGKIERRQKTADDDNTNCIDYDDDCEMSIYYKQAPKTPKMEKHGWNDADDEMRKSTNVYLHPSIDLDQTHQLIQDVCDCPNVNPFNADLINAFLEEIAFTNYISNLPTCQMVGRVTRLYANMTFKIHEKEIDVLKPIGEGAYGSVYCGLDRKTGKRYALKQERPPNYWEYYICLEVQSRIKTEEMLTAYMNVDNALIGNNSSILASTFSEYGSLISVCNKVKKYTMRNVDEYVVMYLTCELLEIIDHLHAIGIIHADIKADNFLLMKKLQYPLTKGCSLQLIDFGVSIDMKLFKTDQTFTYVHHDNAFKCVEMREERPWTYQLDLYGLAGVIHALLFGKYMDVARGTNGIWMHKTHVPRYFNKNLWETIFKSLLNVRDCETMPNLQQLRALLKEEIAEKEKYVIKKIADFNMALSQCN